MERRALNYLIKWLNSPNRRPLVIQGARQVGKTWLVRHFAKTLGKRLIEFNFEDDASSAALFTSNNPQKILLNLEDLFGGPLIPDESVLFFDEIQIVPDLYKRLRWFFEKMPDLAVIVTGSLLEVMLGNTNTSMPVGRLSYMYLEPFSFEEFLHATGHESLCSLLERYTFGTEIPEITHKKLLHLFKEYLIVGGMPAAIDTWISTKSLQEIGLIHRDLLRSYREDFGVYSGRLSSQRLNEVMKKIPLSLGKKFLYRSVNPKVRIETIKKALLLLCNARVCNKVFATAANGIPLEAEIRTSFFKVLFIDVGLCSSMLKLSYSQLEGVDELNLVNSGGIIEQAVGQLLRTLNPLFEEPETYYWTREKETASAELDYVLQHKTQVIPIEVKAGAEGRLKSLHVFMELKETEKAIRIFSGKPVKKKIRVAGHKKKEVAYTLYSLPFYFLEQIHRLLDG